jgi:hypothetical protein
MIININPTTTYIIKRKQLSPFLDQSNWNDVRLKTQNNLTKCCCPFGVFVMSYRLSSRSPLLNPTFGHRQSSAALKVFRLAIHREHRRLWQHQMAIPLHR